MPTMAIGGNTVGDALHRQLRPVCTGLIEHLLPDCGHIVPLDAPGALVAAVGPFLHLYLPHE